MSRFLSSRLAGLEPYVPGEQPRDMQYIKLNTNESPFPPSEEVRRAVEGEVDKLRLYSDPESKVLNEKTAQLYGLKPEQVLMCNGSDEILNFAFMAFGDEQRAFAFPALTYGFYSVFAELHRIPYREIPLKKDFSIDPSDYYDLGMNIVIANPNAPTGMTLSVGEIEEILKRNREHVVVIDEAYVDFGGESCMPLIDGYDNLLVTRTFSKSYSLAGARLGFGAGNAALIADLNAIKYSTNPYNVNRMTMAAGIAAIESNGYYMENCRKIIAARELTKEQLRGMGFNVLDSMANFLFVSHPAVSGQELYQGLRERGILVRHFGREDVKNYVRITIGTQEQMNELIGQTKLLLKEVQSNG